MQRLVREETKIFKSLSFSLCSKIITIHFIFYFFIFSEREYEPKIWDNTLTILK